jgi:hypothetical protein
MNILRRFCSLGLAALLIGALLSGVVLTAGSAAPAAASTPEAFAGTATAQALKLDLFGTTITLGSTNAEADTTPQAVASGSGVALLTATASSAKATSTTPSATPPKACGVNLPLTGILTLSLACSQSAGSVANSAPTATSASNIAAVDIGTLSLVLQLLQPILNALTPIANQVIGSVLTTVNSALTGLGLGSVGTTLSNLLGGLGVSETQPVSSLITALEKATDLATIHVGDSSAGVTTSSGTVIATSSAQAATIDVLPGILVGGGPLLSITVGTATTTSTYNRGTGVSSAAFSPAILTVSLLGINIPVGLGAPVNLLAGTPLASSISLGAGSTTKNADGSVTATADGVGLDLLQGINGGIQLDLAHAASGVGGTVAQITTTTTAAATTTTIKPAVTATTLPPLATTGSDTPYLAIGFTLLLAGYLTRRKLVARRAGPPR